MSSIISPNLSHYLFELSLVVLQGSMSKQKDNVLSIYDPSLDCPIDLALDETEIVNEICDSCAIPDAIQHC
jgi:hypothetical protein